MMSNLMKWYCLSTLRIIYYYMHTIVVQTMKVKTFLTYSLLLYCMSDGYTVGVQLTLAAWHDSLSSGHTPQQAARKHLYPVRMCKGGKVIGHVVVVVVMNTKIAIYHDLGTRATHTHLESIEFGEKLASICFKSRDMIYERQKLCLFLSHHSHTYEQCLLNA